METRRAVNSMAWSRSTTLEKSTVRCDTGEIVCLVCMARAPNVRLEPCCHMMCSECVSLLVAPDCPACRTAIKVVCYIRENLRRSFEAVRAEQVTREGKALEATIQVVVLGQPRVGKKTLIRKLMHMYPLNSNIPAHVMEEDLSNSGIARYSPNALIKNTAVRLVPFTLAPWDCLVADKGAILDSIKDLKPDVFILCASYHRGASFHHLVRWDRALQLKFPDIARFWCLLRYPGFDQLAGDLVDQSYVYNGVKDLPLDRYPKGIFLASPKSRLSKSSLRNLSAATVRLGRKAHGMEDLESITFTPWKRLTCWIERAVYEALVPFEARHVQ
eukprot:Plantae.Rhodophyta-Purpureofilum_apyrenoidigerum.ctg33754.p1 GENE.Plantae.Rhodophyta-Purpureofilum_apyrenoidigerum.ctg33754~~Plantae.Rhodophyta-Purpureofilum_apyrenoidigerum.ctg33754.p1  ORF type:complete len:364 (+),score=51.02 Plantae.Rhodophyta-Purpureofilum_apyrenoidigerum.ctg33754:104-1093(+)